MHARLCWGLGLLSMLLAGCSGGGGGGGNGGGDSLPPEAVDLRFRSVPLSAAVGIPMFELVVRITDENAVVVTAGHASITLSLHDFGGPTDAQLIGEVTQTSDQGIARFPGLQIDRVGEIGLRATGGGLEDIGSEPFVVGAWAHIQPEDYAKRVVVGGDGRIWTSNQYGTLRSDDGAVTFEDVDEAIPFEMTEIAVDPNNADVVYLGATQEAAYKTVDGGSTWTDISPTHEASIGVETLAIDPADSSRILAGEDGADGPAFLTTNGGVSWFNWSNGITFSFVYDVAIAPTSPPTYYAGSAGEIYRRRPADDIWDDLPGTGTTYSLAIDPSNPARIFAGGSGGAIRMSVNGGDSWTDITAGAAQLPSVFIVSLGVDSEGTLYGATEDGIFKTADGGATWSVIDVGGLFPNAVEGLYVDPETPGTLYAATREGLFKTIVGGEL